jgi:hypothetical protein
VNEYGVGPAKPLDRKDPILERAVSLVQQAFPGTVEAPEREESATPPPLAAASSPADASSSQSPAPPPPPDRSVFLEVLRELADEQFGAGKPLAGQGARWLLTQMRRYGVRRIDDLSIEQLYEMCQTLEKDLKWR